MCVIINECRSNQGVRYYDKVQEKYFKARLLYYAVIYCELLLRS
jgi:hypothetical protein